MRTRRLHARLAYVRRLHERLSYVVRVDDRVGGLFSLTTGRSERFSTKLEQIHARNILKEAAEHALLAYLKLFVKHLPNTCLVKNP